MMDIRAGRPATLASNGMVTCPHALASQAGAEILREGGSAIDAAVAASAALSVLYPHMTGIGGDAFWLIYDARTRTVRYIDGGGRATSHGTVEAFTKRGLGEVPYRGVLPGTLTVPGAVASWSMAHAAYGRLPLKRCLETGNIRFILGGNFASRLLTNGRHREDTLSSLSLFTSRNGKAQNRFLCRCATFLLTAFYASAEQSLEN